MSGMFINGRAVDRASVVRDGDSVRVDAHIPGVSLHERYLIEIRSTFHRPSWAWLFARLGKQASSETVVWSAMMTPVNIEIPSWRVELWDDAALASRYEFR